MNPSDGGIISPLWKVRSENKIITLGTLHISLSLHLDMDDGELTIQRRVRRNGAPINTYEIIAQDVSQDMFGNFCGLVDFIVELTFFSYRGRIPK